MSYYDASGDAKTPIKHNNVIFLNPFSSSSYFFSISSSSFTVLYLLLIFNICPHYLPSQEKTKGYCLVLRGEQTSPIHKFPLSLASEKKRPPSVNFITIILRQANQKVSKLGKKRLETRTEPLSHPCVLTLDLEWFAFA